MDTLARIPTYATIHTKLLRQFSSTGDDDIPELNNFLPDYRCAKYTFHDIRHGSGTAVVRETNSLFAAQVHLGHKSSKMTQRYAKFLTEDKIAIAYLVFDK